MNDNPTTLPILTAAQALEVSGKPILYSLLDEIKLEAQKGRCFTYTTAPKQHFEELLALEVEYGYRVFLSKHLLDHSARMLSVLIVWDPTKTEIPASMKPVLSFQP